MKFKKWHIVGLVLIALLAIFIAVKQYLAGPSADTFTHYNNYVIFKQSAIHLFSGQNLYIHYPQEHFDLYKYTPTFSLAMAPFVILPNLAGLILWDLINVLVWALALYKLQQQSNKLFIIGLFVGLLELYITTLNSQSNALITGFLIFAWLNLEKGKFGMAAVFIWATVAIKLFGILFFAMFIFYPGWIKKGIWRTAAWGAIFIGLPAIFIGFKELLWQYQNYFHLLATDHNEFVKYCFVGWVQSWFGLSLHKTYTVVFALVLQLALGFTVYFSNTRQSRVLLVATWLIWMVIFNHMAESATFIIAVTGVIIWWENSALRLNLRMAFLIPVILFTCLGPSDIYPHAWREIIVQDLQLKVFPCILIYAAIAVELLLLKPVKIS